MWWRVHVVLIRRLWIYCIQTQYRNKHQWSANYVHASLNWSCIFHTKQRLPTKVSFNRHSENTERWSNLSDPVRYGLWRHCGESLNLLQDGLAVWKVVLQARPLFANLHRGSAFSSCEQNKGCSIVSAGILEQSMGARNRVPYRPARIHRLEESIPWNRFLGSLKV